MDSTYVYRKVNFLCYINSRDNVIFIVRYLKVFNTNSTEENSVLKTED